MKKERIMIDGIPAILWGETKRNVTIAVHGYMSNKEDEVIRIFAERATSTGSQVLSFDLPEHGERKDNTEYKCNPQNIIEDLKKIMSYVKMDYDWVDLWACSMGAYYSMLAYKDEEFESVFFLSPIVDMKIVIDNIMKNANVSEEELEEKKEIKTEFGPTLYWDYYKFVKENPIDKWNNCAFVLYGKKDNMQDENTIREFCDRTGAFLQVYEDGEHYFHTKEQLDYYEEWLFDYFA